VVKERCRRQLEQRCTLYCLYAALQEECRRQLEQLESDCEREVSALHSRYAAHRTRLEARLFEKLKACARA